MDETFSTLFQLIFQSNMKIFENSAPISTPFNRAIIQHFFEILGFTLENNRSFSAESTRHSTKSALSPSSYSFLPPKKLQSFCLRLFLCICRVVTSSRKSMSTVSLDFTNTTVSMRSVTQALSLLPCHTVPIIST